MSDNGHYVRLCLIVLDVLHVTAAVRLRMAWRPGMGLWSIWFVCIDYAAPRVYRAAAGTLNRHAPGRPARPIRTQASPMAFVGTPSTVTPPEEIGRAHV